jgi:hypothetical protein
MHSSKRFRPKYKKTVVGRQGKKETINAFYMYDLHIGIYRAVFNTNRDNVDVSSIFFCFTFEKKVDD